MLLGAVKFLFTPSAMVTAGYSFYEVVFITLAGAFLGITVFYFGGTAVFAWFNRIRIQSKKPQKVFSRRNRLIVKYKNRLGVVGLAATIGLISVPLCSLLAAKYFHHKRKTIWVLMGSATVWTLALSGISFFFKSLLV